MSKSQTKQKKSSAGKNVAIFFIVFILLEGLLIFGLTKLFKDEDTVVSLGGYSFFIMDTNNMAPDAPKDALVIASNGTPSADKISYPVLCKNVGDEGTTVAWLQDIGSKGDTVDGVVYTVLQNSDTSKTYDLTGSDIIGIATSYYMTAGTIVSFVTTPFGMGISLAAPLVLMIFIEIIIAAARKSHDDDDEYDEDYDDEDEDNVTLDDFLYGGENDDVYVGGKPKDTYEEEFEKAPAPAENSFEDKYAAMMNRSEAQTPVQPTPSEPAYEQQSYPVYDEPAVQEAAPSEEPKPQIDRSYYERASKMIDEAVSSQTATQEIPKQTADTQEALAQTADIPTPAAAPERKAAPSQRPAQPRRRPQQQPARRRPAQQRPRPAVSHKNANEALEQLMKMMEEEQNKLRSKNDGE